MPTQNQANVYAGTLHFLKAMAQAGTRDAVAVNKAMRAMPIAFFGRQVSMRGDGRVLNELTLYRVKAPNESHAPWGLPGGKRQRSGFRSVLAGEPSVRGLTGM